MVCEPASALIDVLIIWYILIMQTTTTIYQRDEHRVHLIVYHLIWCPRRRKSVLIGEVVQRLQQIVEAKCHEHDWVLLTLAIQPDHVHVFVRVWPSDSASYVVKELKGASSH